MLEERRVDVRIGAQGSRDAVDVGVGSYLNRSIIAFGCYFRCHLIPRMVPAES